MLMLFVVDNPHCTARELCLIYTPIGGLEGSPINRVISMFKFISEVLPSDVRHPMKLLLRNYCASSESFIDSTAASFAGSEFVVSTSVSGRL